MSNLKNAAFPLVDIQHANGNEFYRGLSKLEYAAIHIAAHLAGTAAEGYSVDDVAADAVRIAKLTLQKCNE